MPLYEYRCAACGHQLEAVQKFSDPPLTECPSCGAPQLEKLLSQSSFALKGGGWYADGYGPQGAKKEAAGDPKGGAEAKSESGESKSSDGKSKETSSSGDTKKTDAPKKSDGAKASNG